MRDTTLAICNKKHGCHKGNESGFATVTALFLMVIAVMLVTAYSALIQSAVGAVANENYEMLAVGAAMSGVQQAAGYLIDDSSGGADGANDTSWYRLNGDTFIKVSSSLYYRVRIFDEAGKINLNGITTVNSLAGTVIKSYTDHADQPSPPFSDTATNMNLTIAQGTRLLQTAVDSKPFSITGSTDSAQVWLMTPSAINLMVNTTMTSQFHRPFFTVYGWKEANGGKININMAESQVLRAGIIAACSTSVGLTGGSQGIKLAALADKIHNHITNPAAPTTFDTNPNNDTYYSSMDQVAFTPNLTAGEADSITKSDTNLKLIFKVSSSGYFTIYASGYVFRAGANPMIDTPVARSHVIAVLRRSTGVKKGEIIYWRETFDDDVNRMPIGTGSRRYNWKPWDPVY